MSSQPSQPETSWTNDLVSGFFVFLIALPLCLGISMASGVPPVAGILTAIVGGLVATWLGSAELTIKGPAAGLIVIVLGSVMELGGGDAMVGYRRTLAVGAVAASIQIALALFRAGALGDFFPSSVVHGMLAAIGVIICSKQIHVLMGVKPAGQEPLHLLAEIPNSIAHANPEILLIGVISLVILLGHQAFKERLGRLGRLPAPLIVLLIAVPLGLIFDLNHEHTYTWQGHPFPLGPNFLVTLPASIFSAITTPDWSAITSATSIKYIVMFTLVGSLESLLSAKAVDLLDPRHGRSNLDRDLLATGTGNLIASLIGGIPMISEIVRSSANISYGAVSRKSNFFHGLFLLLFVALAPGLIHRIPLAALAAMLIATGLRLASPAEFRRTFQIGTEQLAVFTVTLLVTLATDLLMGVGAGILTKLLLHLRHGAPISGLFTPDITHGTNGDEGLVTVRDAAVFSNYLKLSRTLASLEGHATVVLDLGDTRFVDHTVMEKLHHLREDWERDGRELRVIGLEEHEALSSHPLAARRKRAAGGNGQKKAGNE